MQLCRQEAVSQAETPGKTVQMLQNVVLSLVNDYFHFMKVGLNKISSLDSYETILQD